MRILVYSLLGVMQDLYHQPQEKGTLVVKGLLGNLAAEFEIWAVKILGSRV